MKCHNFLHTSTASCPIEGYPDSKVHLANMGSTWGRQDPGGLHVGLMNFAIRGIRVVFIQHTRDYGCGVISEWMNDRYRIHLFSALFHIRPICLSVTKLALVYIMVAVAVTLLIRMMHDKSCFRFCIILATL